MSSTPLPVLDEVFSEKNGLAYLDHDRLMDCIHCGLCLSQCPTYAEEGLEADSPRGRIYLMRALKEGHATPTPELVSHLDLCLGCRACETACPSGVQYGSLIEGARAYLREEYPRPPQQRVLGALIEAIFPYPNRLDLAMAPVKIGRRLGIIPLLHKIGVMKKLGYLGELEAMLPALSPTQKRLAFPANWQANGEKQARVGMITGCVMPVMLLDVNIATAKVLARAGCEVVAPKNQVCCGALHAHTGGLKTAKEFAKKNIEAFEEIEKTDGALDAIIINAAGCGASLKEYGHWFHGDEMWQTRAENFAAKVRDVSEWLDLPPYKTRLQQFLTPKSSTRNAIKSAPNFTENVLSSASSTRNAPQIASEFVENASAPKANNANNFAENTDSANADRESASPENAHNVTPNTVGASTIHDGKMPRDDANLTEAQNTNSATTNQSAPEIVTPNSASTTQKIAAPHEIPTAKTIESTSAIATIDTPNRQSSIENRQAQMTYHDACHLAHGQGIRSQPRDLMNLCDENGLAPLEESEMCCGSAGIYNLTQPKMALQLLERKMRHIEATGAKIVVTGNPGCIMQLMLGARKFGVEVEIKHPVEILEKATRPTKSRPNSSKSSTR